MQEYGSPSVRLSKSSELKVMMPEDAPFSLLSGNPVALWVYARATAQEPWIDASGFCGLTGLRLRGLMDPSTSVMGAWEWAFTLTCLAEREDLIAGESLPVPTSTPWPRRCDMVYEGQGQVRIKFLGKRPGQAWDGVKMLQAVADAINGLQELCDVASKIEANPDFFWGTSPQGPQHFYEVVLGNQFRLRHRGLSLWEVEDAPLVEVGADNKHVALRRRGGAFYLISPEESLSRILDGRGHHLPWKAIEDALNTSGNLADFKFNVDLASEPIRGILRALRSMGEQAEDQIDLVVGSVEHFTLRARSGVGKPSLRFRLEPSAVVMAVLDEREGVSKWHFDGQEKCLPRPSPNLMETIETEVTSWWWRCKGGNG